MITPWESLSNHHHLEYYPLLLLSDIRTALLTNMSLYPGVALITGAASGEYILEKDQSAITDCNPGISQATAVSFAREGCTKIVLADRDEQGLEKTQRLISETIGEGKAQVLAIKTDVTSSEQIDHLVNSAVERFGRIDYSVNGAGERHLVSWY